MISLSKPTTHGHEVVLGGWSLKNVSQNLNITFDFEPSAMYIWTVYQALNI